MRFGQLTEYKALEKQGKLFIKAFSYDRFAICFL